jgi:exonuclease VII small subunit
MSNFKECSEKLHDLKNEVQDILSEHKKKETKFNKQSQEYKLLKTK